MFVFALLYVGLALRLPCFVFALCYVVLMLVAVFRFVLCLSMCCYPFYFVLFVSVFRVRLVLCSPAYHLLCFALSCCALLLCCLVLFCCILAVFPWFAFALVCFAFLCLFCSVPISFALLCSILLRRALFRLVFVSFLIPPGLTLTMQNGTRAAKNLTAKSITYLVDVIALRSCLYDRWLGKAGLGPRKSLSEKAVGPSIQTPLFHHVFIYFSG